MSSIKPQVVAAIVLVSACSAYQPPAGAPTAKLNLKGNGNTWICVDGKRQSLRPDASGYVDIPAGSRLTVGAPYGMEHDGMVSTCDAKSSIVPEPGRRYYMEFRMDSKTCGVLIFKEDSTSRATPELEPSLRGGLACGHS